MTNLVAVLCALIVLASAHAGGRLSPAAKDFLPIAIREGYVDSAGSLHGSEDDDVSITEQLALSTNSVDLQVYLGVSYLYQDPPNEDSALKWITRAAEQGNNTVASLAAGLLLYHRRQLGAARPLLKQASEAGEMYGHYYLGRLIFEEASQNQQRSQTPEIDEAASLFTLAVDEIVEAQHSLAVMHEYGLLGEADTESSAEFLHEEAARRGSIASMYHLALMYAFGRGPTQDFYKAQSLFQRVIEHNPDHAPSLRFLGLFQAKGYGSIAPDYDAAIVYYEDCAKAAGDEEYPEIGSICVDERDRLSDVIQRVRNP